MEDLFKQRKFLAPGSKPDVPYNGHKKGTDDGEAFDSHNWGTQRLAQA